MTPNTGPMVRPKSSPTWPDFVFWIVILSFAGACAWFVALELLS